MWLVRSTLNGPSHRHLLVPKLMPWKTPLNVLPELPGGAGLSNVTLTLAAATVNVTPIVFGLPVAPLAVAVIVAVYVPVASPVGLTETLTVALPAPAASDVLNHAAVSLTVHVSVPPPVLLIVRLWATGAVPPCTAVKDRLLGVTLRAGA